MESEENFNEMSVCQQNTKYLLQVANFLSSSCPPASRFYMMNVERTHQEFPDLLKNSTKVSYEYCHHCGSIWSADNCRVRIQKRPSLNCHLKKIINLEANQPWKLNNRQKKKLKKFQESTNKLVYNCLICKKKTVFPGSKKLNIKCRSLEQPSSSTPISKIKPKKCDLNAGLFIESPCTTDTSERNNLENSEISERIKECETPVGKKEKFQLGSESPVTTGGKSKNLNIAESKVTPRNVKPVPELADSSAEKQSASKKRKKTLLAQILSQEQSKKKKTSLSSFLVSL